MATTIGANIAALKAIGQLTESTSSLGKVYERLASGQRINGASDDPAGLALSTSLRTNARIFSTGMRNVNDAISALTMADSALSALSDITIRGRELSMQAANATYSAAQRRALNAEANALAEEYNRIIATTEFNGMKLLDNTFSNVSIQTGSSSMSLDIGDSLSRTVGTGIFQTPVNINMPFNANRSSTLTGDVNGDGHTDIVISDLAGGSCFGVMLGNGNGTFKVETPYSVPAWPNTAQLADVNHDGSLDMVMVRFPQDGYMVALNNGNGTFKAEVDYSIGFNLDDAQPAFGFQMVDVNNDNNLDIIGTTGNLEVSDVVLLGNGDGSFKLAVSYYVGWGSANVMVADFNNDGKMDIVTSGFRCTNIQIGNGDGTFNARVTLVALDQLYGGSDVGDLNGDGIPDLAFSCSVDNTLITALGNGNGTFRITTGIATNTSVFHYAMRDLNGDGASDLIANDMVTSKVVTMINNGNGTFRAPNFSQLTGNNPTSPATADFNEDGILEAFTVPWSAVGYFLNQNTQQVVTLPRVSLYTAADALISADVFKAALDRVDAERGSIGAYQSRLGFELGFLQTSRENYLAAASRITDVDVAEETANLVRLNILQQAGVAIVSHATNDPSLVLKLLQNL